MSNKQKDERKFSHERFLSIVDLCSRTFTQLVKWGGITSCFYFAYKAIASLSGNDTIANVAVTFVTDLKINQWLCYLIATVCGGWAFGERRLRRKRTTALHRRNKELEKLINKNRTSSSLPPDGGTRKEDQI
jgi:hypothetical protein